MKFKAGDIIRGTEGDGQTWANTTTLLLLYVNGVGSRADVCGLILKSVNPLTGEEHGRIGKAGPWSLCCRQWEKIGQVSQLSAASDAVRQCVERFAQSETDCEAAGV